MDHEDEGDPVTGEPEGHEPVESEHGERARGEAAPAVEVGDSDPPPVDVLILGGGLAGLSAALPLAERGLSVRLVEREQEVGGKLSGWRTPAGLPVEHAMHGFWSCYRNLAATARHVTDGASVFTDIEPSGLLYSDGSALVARARGRVTLPAPFHLLRFGRPSGVSAGDLALAGPAFVKMVTFDASSDEYALWDDMSFKDFLWRNGVGRSLYERILDPLMPAVTFRHSDEVSASVAMALLKFYLLSHDGDFAHRWLRGPPHERLLIPWREHLSAKGAEVSLETSAVELVLDADGARALGARLRRDGERPVLQRARHVVVALDVKATRELLPPALRGAPGWNDLYQLDTVPAIAIRLFFAGRTSRDVPRSGMFVGFESVDNYFLLERIFDELLPGSAGVVEVHLSIATSAIDLSEEELVARARRDIERAFPDLVGVELLDHHITRSRGELFHFAVGQDRYRPTVRTDRSGLWLAGDWIKRLDAAGRRINTWYMENAVSSGLDAANLVLSLEGRERWPVAPPRVEEPALRVLDLLERGLRGARRRAFSLAGFEPILD